MALLLIIIAPNGHILANIAIVSQLSLAIDLSSKGLPGQLPKKKNKLWIWLAFDRSGQRLVDWECGDRDAATLNRLLERLKPWSVKLYCTDDYAPYDTLLPVGRHYIGKDETVAIERINSRLRHWFARFRRRTCVVSKALEMVDATIALFAAYHVNRTAAKLTLPLTA